jgi:hypothetical protein
MKCVLNNKFIGIDNNDDSMILSASSTEIGLKETFIVYFGPENKIMFRSKFNLNFISIEYSAYDYLPMLVVNGLYHNSFVFEAIDLDEIKNIR